MLRFVLFVAVTLSLAATAAMDAKSAYARLVALDEEFARVIRTSDLPRYMAAKQRAEDLIGSLGRDPTDPCRIAAVELRSSRVNEWIARQSPRLSDTARQTIESERRRYVEASATCKASGSS